MRQRMTPGPPLKPMRIFADGQSSPVGDQGGAPMAKKKGSKDKKGKNKKSGKKKK
ncbi:hypothetical protein LWF15_19810 [Kineosporia rhizophila]|uniref:hypothetical protein n=1 Tax=Kineosporia rhizophila TaxID=84633 RepID=UPI000A77AD4B|nr:hypothetical protein [Kineosporia rhizophila]MCE0537742.1 hypothetical protein [Kineosporia rhizophila]